MKLIDLVNSVITSNDLTWIVNFYFQIPECESYSPAFLDLFISLDASICSAVAFPSLGNSDHVIVSLSIDFPINLKQDALFHRLAYDYYAVWDSFCDKLKDVTWEDIFNCGAFAAASEFVSGLGLGLTYISLIVSIGSSLTNPIKIFFFCLCQHKSSESKLKFRQASNCC